MLGAVPGTFSSMAEIEPPNSLAPLAPENINIACSAGMPHEKGISRARAVLPPMPGRTPKISPKAVPCKKYIRLDQ